MAQAAHPTRLHDPLRRDICAQAVQHMVRAVEQTPAESDPFPHFIVRGIFPEGIYSELLAQLPEPDMYEPFAYEKHSTDGASNRGRFQLVDARMEKLEGRTRSFWFGLRDALGAPEFKAAVFGKLRAGLAFRLGTSEAEAARTPGYPLPELFRETKGYAIKPHPDTRRKVVTMQIALPWDESQQHLGTEFYRRSLNPLHLFREPRGFEIVKQAPFLPNTAYAFSVINALTLKSWHGRTTLGADAGVRNTILNIWYAKASDANPDLVERYYRQAA
jgi:hypothetical protein